MPLILHLETSTTVCSVAIGRDGKCIAIKEINTGYTHAENLTIFIKEVLKETNYNFSSLDAIAVSKGPGSYTGLRIGVSTAKGLCYALNKPLIAVNTLQAMAYGVSYLLLNEKTFSDFIELKNKEKEKLLLCPMIDARRMEVYCAFYDLSNKEFRKPFAEVVTENSFRELLTEHHILFFGDGSQKCKDKLSHHARAIFIDNIFPSAKNMISLAKKGFQDKQFEDVAYFEPYYLKNFIPADLLNS